MHGDWSPGPLRDALAAMQEEGYTQGDIARLSGVNRSQVNRWARGENRPTYDRALQLARHIGRRHPAVAAQFMTASGYTWAGDTEPEPEPAIPPDLMAVIRRTLSPEEQERAIAALNETLSGPAAPATAEGEQSPRPRRAG